MIKDFNIRILRAPVVSLLSKLVLLILVIPLISACIPSSTAYVSRTGHNLGLRQHALTNIGGSLAIYYEHSAIAYDDAIIEQERDYSEAETIGDKYFYYTGTIDHIGFSKFGLGLEYGITDYTTIDAGFSYCYMNNIDLSRRDQYVEEVHPWKIINQKSTDRIENNIGIKQRLTDKENDYSLSLYGSMKMSSFDSSNRVKKYDATSQEYYLGFISGYTFTSKLFSDEMYYITPSLSTFYYNNKSDREETFGILPANLDNRGLGYELNLHFGDGEGYVLLGSGFQVDDGDSLKKSDFYAFGKIGFYIFQGE
jgi:hypothetical protein